MKNVIQNILNEIKDVLSNVKEEEAITVSDRLQEANRIFLYGEGRSGLMAKAFAMRLMHGGYQVFVIGETTTPSIEKGDLLIVVSGNGSSKSQYHYISKARGMGVKVLLVTSNVASEIAKVSDDILHIPASTKYRHRGEPSTVQPLGNQFDQSVHLILDAIIIYCLKTKGGGNIHQNMQNRHATFE